MARKAILDTYYTFTPATRTVVIPRAIKQERLVLITDTATNTVIYNFSDPTLKATSYTVATDPTGAFTTTTIVLNYNTTSLTTTDKLQIIVDEYDEKISPSETMTDPVNKLRVSQPQSLIDTDFEYSTQFTKWEQLALLNNRPFGYYSVVQNLINVQAVGQPLGYGNIQSTLGSRTFIANTFPVNAPVTGNAIAITDSTFAGADGIYIIDSNPTTYEARYTGKFQANSTTSGTAPGIWNNGITQAFAANIFSNASIGLTSVSTSGVSGQSAANLITVVTSIEHGLALGNEIALTGLTAGTNPPNGSYVVQSIANTTAFSFYCNSTVTGTAAGPFTITNANLYARPPGNTLHRPTAAGIRFSTNTQSHNHQFIRQTRRYFRYQSGKGIQMSTGTTLMPNLVIDQISTSAFTTGAVITVITKDPHNIWSTLGVKIKIGGVNEAGYNGTFSVNTVIDPYTFTYLSTSAVSATLGSGGTGYYGSGQYQGSVVAWYGGSTRIGLFDNQNGVYFEFDGQQLWVCRRSSTYNLSGSVAVTTGSTTVTGTNTLFSKQLVPGDFVTIKGMSYRVNTVTSDTTLTITPAYRGLINTSGVIITKTIDYRIPQSAWNIDRADGTGPSGFTITLDKMQMFYIDYSWYGAGYIRFGFRGADGNVIYCHKMINNNVNQVAYMRSGNLPARYETNTFSKTAFLTASVGASDTTINVSDAYQWPTTGIAIIRNTSTYEYINYTNISQVAQGTYVLSAGSQTINIVSGTNSGSIAVGQYVNGYGIDSVTTVQAIPNSTSIILSKPPTITSNANGLTINFAPTLTGVIRAQAGTSTGVSVTTTAWSPVISLANTTGVQIGQYIQAAGIPNNAYVVSFVTNTSVTMSLAATASATVNAVFVSPGATTGQTFTYSATNPIAVELHAPQYASEINHWGTSAIMDGQFTRDKEYIFTKGMTSFANVWPGQSSAVMSFRVAPTASQGQPGLALGYRDVVNHMQLIPYELDAYSNGSFLISIVLNGTANASPGWTNVGGSSLSQFQIYGANTTVSGGETVFGFYMNTPGVQQGGGPGPGATYNTTQQDMSFVKDLGTSILSGGQVAGNVAIYPDGPEVMTIVATNLTNPPATGGAGFPANLVARFSWNEAQA